MTQQPLNIDARMVNVDHFDNARRIALGMWRRRNKAAAVSEWAAELRAGLAEKLRNGAR